MFKDVFAEREILSLLVKCPSICKEHGCQWQGQLRFLQVSRIAILSLLYLVLHLFLSFFSLLFSFFSHSANTVKSCMKRTAYVQFFNFWCDFSSSATDIWGQHVQRFDSVKPVKAVLCIALWRYSMRVRIANVTELYSVSTDNILHVCLWWCSNTKYLFRLALVNEQFFELQYASQQLQVAHSIMLHAKWGLSENVMP